MTLRLAAVALAALLLAHPARAQESVFNLPALGVPGTGASIRARALGGAGLGLEGEPFTVEDPSQLARFTRGGFHLAAIGQRVDVEDRTRTGEIEDVSFPMGVIVVPAWGSSVVGLGFYQFLDFDAAVETEIVFEGESLPVRLRSDGGVSVLAPAVALMLDERTAVGLSLDIYLGSRNLVREVESGDIAPGAVTTVDSLTRDFRALGVTLGAERRFGDARLAAAWHWRPAIDSRITRAPGGGLAGGTTEFDIPAEFVVGGSVPLSRRVAAAGILRWSDWSGVDDPAGSELGGSFEVGGGVEFAPGQPLLWVVGPEAPLRAGARWRRLPLRVEGEPVDEWAVTAGYGRAFPGAWSRVDVLVEIGRRGGIDSVGVRERFLRLGIALSAFEPLRRSR